MKTLSLLLGGAEASRAEHLSPSQFDQPAKERRARGRDAATRSVWLAMRSLCLTPWKTDRQPAVLGDTALQQAPQTPLALAPASLQRWSAQTPESAESRSAAVGVG